MAKKTPEVKQATKTTKATIRVADLRKQTVQELADTLKSVNADLTEARRTHAAGELVNPRVLSMTKKTIARIKTLQVEKTREEGRK